MCDKQTGNCVQRLPACRVNMKCKRGPGIFHEDDEDGDAVDDDDGDEELI